MARIYAIWSLQNKVVNLRVNTEGLGGYSPLENMRIVGVERQESMLFLSLQKKIVYHIKQGGLGDVSPGKFQNFRC